MIALHNLLDTIRVEGWQGPGSPTPALSEKLWIVLHQPFYAFRCLGDNSPVIAVVYPLIPWIGVMAVGYVFGALYQLDAQRRTTLVADDRRCDDGALRRDSRHQTFTAIRRNGRSRRTSFSRCSRL